MQMSHNECQELKARYEEASSETQAKHEEVLQNLQKMLLDAGERLKAAQKENSDLLQETEELRRQADKARVYVVGRIVLSNYGLLAFRVRAARGLGKQQHVGWVQWPLPVSALRVRGRRANYVSCIFKCFV